MSTDRATRGKPMKRKVPAKGKKKTGKKKKK